MEGGEREKEGEGRKNWVIGVWERGWERDIKDEGVGFLVLEERLERVRYRGEGSRLLFAVIWWHFVARQNDEAGRTGGSRGRREGWGPWVGGRMGNVSFVAI